MYIPKSQYVFKKMADFLKEGEQLLDANGIPVLDIGQDFVLSSTGAIFAKKGINFDTGDFTGAIQFFKGLFDKDINLPQQTSEQSSEGPLQELGSLKLAPTTADLKKGEMKRYFVKNKCIGTLAETTKKRYVKLEQQNDRCIQLETINWKISGTIEDTTVNGYFLEGVKSKNEKTLKRLEKIFPGVTRLIPNVVEYVKEVPIPTANPINKQKRDTVIPSPGKSL